MKKNLLSIVILALLIVNIVLNVVIMFSVLGTNKKTAAVVTDIATVLNLELSGDGEEATTSVSIDDTAVYTIEDEMTILLTKGDDGNDHYALVQVSLSLNTKADGYSNYSASLSDMESLIKGEITDVISKYTADEVTARTDEIKAKILSNIQEMYDSDFIYKVTFSELIVQ